MYNFYSILPHNCIRHIFLTRKIIMTCEICPLIANLIKTTAHIEIFFALYSHTEIIHIIQQAYTLTQRKHNGIIIRQTFLLDCIEKNQFSLLIYNHEQLIIYARSLRATWIKACII